MSIYLFIIFLSYIIGGCYNSDVHECSNGHCIPRMYNCSEDIKACGDVNDECEEITADETHVDFLSSIFRYILVFVAFVCIISLLKVMFKKGRRKCGDIAENLEECLRGLGTRCRRCRNSVCFWKYSLMCTHTSFNHSTFNLNSFFGTFIFKKSPLLIRLI